MTETSVWKRNINWLLPQCTLTKVKPITQACALTRNRTRDLLVYRKTLQSTKPHGTGGVVKPFLWCNKQSSFLWYSGQATGVGTKLPGPENIGSTRSSWKQLENKMTPRPSHFPWLQQPEPVGLNSVFYWRYTPKQKKINPNLFKS